MKVIEENRYVDEKDSIRQRSAERWVQILTLLCRHLDLIKLMSSCFYNLCVEEYCYDSISSSIFFNSRRAERKAKHDEIKRKYGKWNS